MARILLNTMGMISLATLVIAAQLLLLVTVAGACLFPPELEAGTSDAGPGSSPVIFSSGPAPDFLFPGPLFLDRQDSRTLSLTVLDNDIDDVVHVRLYIDYGRPNPEPAYAECQAAPTGEATRVLACPVNTLCNPIADTDQGEHVLEAMVADREFLQDSDPAAEGQDLFRALKDPNRAAFSYRSWIMRCNVEI
ncbi:MAG: hypothetical protein GY811_12845 [Myxococcales bacterium]|nr:hypothetical protein [Myxococcales bacterium]